jgi:hypothetical protein
MNSRVKIIKREHIFQDTPPAQDENTGRMREREIATTVKHWIAELAQRRRTEESTLFKKFTVQTLPGRPTPFQIAPGNDRRVNHPSAHDALQLKTASSCVRSLS